MRPVRLLAFCCLALAAPGAPAAAPPSQPSGAPLSEAELDALDKALQPLDAFLVHSVKQVALESGDGELRQRLFTLLLESRYRLAAILSGEASTTGDPLRALFIDTWTELRSILAQASPSRYGLFIQAGDALIALDRAAPALGVRLSAEGLRRLARILGRGANGDPLAFAWTVDPQLQRLFDVEDIPGPAPAPFDRAPAPPQHTAWLELLVPSAHAHAAPKLDPWVPSRGELKAYEARIRALLRGTSASELERAKLAAPYDAIYRYLLPTTALIESCWRQYVVRGSKITYLRSQSNSVGLMQVNQRVWRGFYDVQRLRWDTAYNIRAGAQILMRYLKDYAIPYARRTGKMSHVPRAAYAAYNAGPRAAGRFNKARPHPREARVDARLWRLYQGIASGGRADVQTCGVDTAAQSQ